MSKDKRYKTLNNLISGGYIKTLSDVFDTLPKSVLAKDLGISLDRFDKMIADVERFQVRKLVKAADLIEVPLIAVLTLIANQQAMQNKSKKKSK